MYMRHLMTSCLIEGRSIGERMVWGAVLHLGLWYGALLGNICQWREGVFLRGMLT
jgi:hypothetical protein